VPFGSGTPSVPDTVNNQSAAAIECAPDVQREEQHAPASSRPKRQPPYAVVLFNDDDHAFEFVVETLMKVFGYPLERCYQLTLHVHEQGRGIVWSGTRELAELKRDQIRAAGPCFLAGKKIDYPLGVGIEPLPG
jgi:ATP-dependent Clp protease adaptor protein ClpS